MKRIIITIIIVAAILGVFIYSRLGNTEQFARTQADPIVEVETPTYGDIEVESSVIGTVSSEESVAISLKAGGDVTDVLVRAGDTVAEGQLLLTIDTQQLETIQNQLDSAELALRQAQENLQRQSVLYSGGGISEQAYQQYQDQVTSAQIACDNAQIAYDNQLSYSNITAPIAGTVESMNVERLDSVNAGFTACVISGGSAKNVEFSVSERVMEGLSVGDPIVIEKDSTEYDGSIIEISTMVNETTGMFDIKARIDESADTTSLPTGSMVKLTLVSERSENVMRVPVDAVYFESGSSYVYTYDPDGSILHRVDVETGLYNSDYMEIDSGLESTDQVVVTWISELYEGSHVRLNDAGEEAADAVIGGSDAATSIIISDDTESQTEPPTENAAQSESVALVPDESSAQ